MDMPQFEVKVYNVTHGDVILRSQWGERNDKENTALPLIDLRVPKRANIKFLAKNELTTTVDEALVRKGEGKIPCRYIFHSDCKANFHFTKANRRPISLYTFN
ncbi:hypothetical protein PVC01_140062300 [Plasmodium vivax]|uniref:(malaria parasite P. vivax) hypothetical protein n=1 Tax=Plasmodium vivax TaxID=5855 RepID=A0A1G4HL55_PLAVI|nr:unnamed protein product [Plasmodium vivax]CAI7723724.1 hypothetical protein PVPAM_140064800 [Plasmodium vivax]SCO70139.1 hypothetical protein PVT01_140061700 [Plasmodium vivax]SCO75631.1 hypothetical protein PVC01_140062300 [Plasmodium vivax]